jgi:hypothetical protein
VTDDERKLLAAEWRSLRAESSETTLRHFRDGTVETRPIDGYDGRIRTAAGSDWSNAARLVGDIMGRTEDAYVSDVFIFWRVRELARRGVLELDPRDAPLRESRVRRVL